MSEERSKPPLSKLVSLALDVDEAEISAGRRVLAAALPVCLFESTEVERLIKALDERKAQLGS